MIYDTFPIKHMSGTLLTEIPSEKKMPGEAVTV